MDIAVFTDTYLPTMDGVVRNIELYRRELARLGHHTEVFAPSTGWSERSQGDVHYVRARPLRRYPGYRLAIYPGSLDSMVDGTRFDVVHAHGFAAMGLKGMVLARRRGLPFIHTFHTMVPLAFRHFFVDGVDPRFFEWVFWRYMRSFLKRCTASIYPSEWARRSVLRSISLDLKNTHVVPTGVDTRLYAPDLRKRSSSPTYILHVGRVSREKSIEDAIEIAGRLQQGSDVRLVVVGEGPALGFYREHAARRGVDAMFTGFVNESELLSWYQKGSMLILPSRFETQGLVALEAMACGLPVLARRHPGYSGTVVEGVSGFYFNDTDEAVKGASGILEDLEALSAGARATAERFDISLLARTLESIYERAIHEHR